MRLSEKISFYNRGRKWQLFLDRFRPDQDTTVLDAGFSEEEYSGADNYLEKHYPYPEKVTALSVDQPSKFRRRYPAVKAIPYSGRHFPFADKEFDICWSNAVLEHVGDRSEQTRFLREIRRVSRHGFLTTPNRGFPIEIHTRLPFLHWLPKAWFDRVLPLFGKSWAGGEYMHLLNQRQLELLLKQAGVTDYTIHKNKLFGFTLDFVVMY